MSKSPRPAGFVSKNDYIMIDPRHIVILDGWNPRVDFSEDKMTELKESIRATGVFNPVRVTVRDGKYILRDGERRVRCCLELIEEGHDIAAIPAMTADVKRGMTEADHLLFAMVANLGDPLKPLEEAEAFFRLINYGMTPQMIAERLGKSVTFVNNRLTLRTAVPELKEAVVNEEVSITEAVTAIKEAHVPEDQMHVVTEIQEKKAKVKKERKEAKQAAKVVVAPEDDTHADLPVLDMPPVKVTGPRLDPEKVLPEGDFILLAKEEDEEETPLHNRTGVILSDPTWQDELAGMVDDHGLEEILQALIDYTSLEEVKAVTRFVAESL